MIVKLPKQCLICIALLFTTFISANILKNKQKGEND